MQHSEPEGARGGLAAAGPPATQLKLLEAALAASSEGVIIVDAAGRLVFLNPAARALVGQEITAALRRYP